MWTYDKIELTSRNVYDPFAGSYTNTTPIFNELNVINVGDIYKLQITHFVFNMDNGSFQLIFFVICESSGVTVFLFCICLE